MTGQISDKTVLPFIKSAHRKDILTNLSNAPLMDLESAITELLSSARTRPDPEKKDGKDGTADGVIAASPRLKDEEEESKKEDPDETGKESGEGNKEDQDGGKADDKEASDKDKEASDKDKEASEGTGTEATGKEMSEYTGKEATDAPDQRQKQLADTISELHHVFSLNETIKAIFDRPEHHHHQRHSSEDASHRVGSLNNLERGQFDIIRRLHDSLIRPEEPII
jgi:hypothetical protein